MTDQTIYGNSRTARHSRAERSMPRFIDDNTEAARPTEAAQSYLATLDKPLLIIVGLLLAIGAGMVFSTTFNWSLESRGSPTAIFLQDHMRNVVIGLIGLVIFSRVDYRFWRRFAPLLLLVTLAALIAVLIFGDDTFGARRSLINGRLQPGELAEFTVVIYMAAWLGSKRTRPDSVVFGLIPFGVLLGLIIFPIVLQPDISSAAIIGSTAVAMYFLSGARIWHLTLVGLVAAGLGLTIVQTQSYAQSRVLSYFEALADPTQANYHTQQVIISFVNGGWLGTGLGQSSQKFGILPAPHTDSIFAVIGEELGVVGAAFVVFLFIAFVMRGFQIARRAVDPFGALLVVGFTVWVAVQALLNIAVMTAIIPSTGLPLPFISFGGSALLVTMLGVGLMLSVGRIATLRENASLRRQDGATYDRGWGNRRARLSRTGRRRGPAQARRRES